MTTYESMMVLIAILNLLIAVYNLDRESKRAAGQLNPDRRLLLLS